MAVTKPNVQPRRPLPSQAAPAGSGKVRAAQPRSVATPAPKAIAQQVMAHKALPRANANYVAGRLANPLDRITKAAPRIGPGRITTTDALAFLEHHFPSSKKTA